MLKLSGQSSCACPHYTNVLKKSYSVTLLMVEIYTSPDNAHDPPEVENRRDVGHFQDGRDERGPQREGGAGDAANDGQQFVGAVQHQMDIAEGLNLNAMKK